MSLYGALFSGVSGLAAQSSAMGAISDNITNVNTIGYKGSKVNFSTLVTKQVSLTNYSPGGVQSKPRTGVDVQGLLQATNSSTDVALSGQGFFVVNEAADPGNGDMFAYTRAGSFKVDREGYLQNVSGWYMQGWPLASWDNSAQASTVQVGNNIFQKSYKDDDGNTVYINDNIVSADHLRPINLNEVGGTASQSRNLRMGANLPNGADIGKIYKQPVTIYDSLGGDATLQFSWSKTAQNTWDVEAYPPEAAKSLHLKNAAGDVYAAMGRLDFEGLPTAASTFTMAINGTTYTINTTNGTDGVPANNIYVNAASFGSTGAFVQAVSTKLNSLFQMEYNSQTIASQDDLVPNDTAITVNGTPVAVAGMTLAEAVAAIDGLAGITATLGGGGTNISITNNTGGAIAITGTGQFAGLTNAALADTATQGPVVPVLVDEALGENSTFTAGGITYNMSGRTVDAAVALINADVATHGITAINNGGSLVMYAGGANDVVVTGAAGDFAGITAIAGTAGKTYVERLAGTNSVIMRQFDSNLITGPIVVAGLSNLLLTNSNPATKQGGDPILPDQFTLSALDIDQGFNANAIEFNGDGTPRTINVSSIEIDWANGSTDMTGSDEIGMFLGNLNIRDGMTQLNGDYQLAYWSQNGAKFGNFAGVTIGADGIVTALFDNGVTRPVFQIPVATFVNPNGMSSVSGNVYIATDHSGEPTLRTAGGAGAGQMAAASLEASTVDIGEEFTTMIVTQRAYSASAKIITTADEMLDELIRIKR